MGIPKTYTILDTAVYNTDKIEIVGDKFQLKLQQDDIDFTEDFADDTGFTYDSNLAEFPGGQVQQIDKRPANAIAYASFNLDENLNWGEGTLNGTLNGNASVSGGELDLTGGDANVEYNTDNLVSMIQEGCIRIRWKPNYTGNAPAIQEIFQSNISTVDRIHLRHNVNFFQCYVYNSSGVLLFNMSFVWTPSTIKYYEVELNFNATAGIARIFIDGQLQDSDSNTGTRTENNLFRIGASSGMDSYIDSVLIFDTVQHTSNYTPDWSDVYNTIYLGSSIILPEMEHTGVGTIKLFNSFSIIESGSPRYVIQIGRSGDYLYWSGSAWVVSDETYDQANDVTTFNSNCGSLSVDGEEYGQFMIIFPDTNIQCIVDELTANMNVDIGYPTDNPVIIFSETILHEGLENISGVVEQTGSDDVELTFSKGTVDYYFDTSDWVVSSGYPQSNTIAEAEAAKASFTIEGFPVVMTTKVYLYSDDGNSTPAFESLTLEYDFVGTEDAPPITVVYGWARNIDGTPSTEPFDIVLYHDAVKYPTVNLVRNIPKTIVTPRANGYWEQPLIPTDDMESGSYYEARFPLRTRKFLVENTDYQSFNDCILPGGNE